MLRVGGVQCAPESAEKSKRVGPVGGPGVGPGPKMCVAPGVAPPTRQNPSGGPTSEVLGWVLIAVWFGSTSTGGSKTMRRPRGAAPAGTDKATAGSSRSMTLTPLYLQACARWPC